MAVDYSLYLVTDNTPAILGSRDLISVVKEAVEGGQYQTPPNVPQKHPPDHPTGATIVQLRDKTSDTSELIRIAKELHQITKPHGVPLLINDRVDVALATGVDGVHIGQDDIGESMDFAIRAMNLSDQNRPCECEENTRQRCYHWCYGKHS